MTFLGGRNYKSTVNAGDGGIYSPGFINAARDCVWMGVGLKVEMRVSDPEDARLKAACLSAEVFMGIFSRCEEKLLSSLCSCFRA